MRRVVAVVVGTLGGLALLASFHTSATSSLRATAPSTASRPPATAPPPQGSGTGASGAPGSTSAPSTTTTAPGGRRTIDGPSVSTRYGDVQVRAVVQGGRLVDVQALTLPSDRERSARISDFAGPELHDEALQAQSANIDVVSGATYTSEGYAQSLQAALDRAGIHS
ncbi:MAG TPA: FMN-binding protein [Acidimicrobiia bacterium]|jgi:uncharacterized protein with FMN-binding domain